MGFVRSEERNSLKFMGTGEFYDMERLTVFFETKPEVVRRLLPPPLKPGIRCWSGGNAMGSAGFHMQTA